jgi:hypothetical protein
MEAMGPLYREIRRTYGDSVEINVLDPRNLISMLPLLICDFRNHGVALADAIRTLRALPVSGVIVNGRVIASGRWPELEELEPYLGEPPRTSAGARS